MSLSRPAAQVRKSSARSERASDFGEDVFSDDSDADWGMGGIIDGADEGDEDDDEKKRETKSTRVFKMKKYLASKGAGSAAGKKAVMHYLGPHGADLITTLEAVAAVQVGKKQSMKHTSNILKCSLKAKLLHSEKLLTQSDIASFVAPVDSLAISFYGALLNVNHDNEVVRRNTLKTDFITPLALEFLQLSEMVTRLLTKHIKEKNVIMAQKTIDYYGSHDFLNLFFLSEETASDRLRFQRDLEVVMKERLDEHNMRPKADPCIYPACNEESQLPFGKIFIGSKYCEKHHLVQYNAMTKAPYLKHFLYENGKEEDNFERWAAENKLSSLARFCIVCRNYQNQKDQVGIRKVFAPELNRKFLVPGSVHDVTEYLSDGVKSAINAKLKEFTITLFDEAQKEIERYLEKPFQTNFVPSDGFKTYMRSIKIPEL